MYAFDDYSKYMIVIQYNYCGTIFLTTIALT